MKREGLRELPGGQMSSKIFRQSVHIGEIGGATFMDTVGSAEGSGGHPQENGDESKGYTPGVYKGENGL
jgi:hypothetical protein